MERRHGLQGLRAERRPPESRAVRPVQSKVHDAGVGLHQPRLLAAVDRGGMKRRARNNCAIDLRNFFISFHSKLYTQDLSPATGVGNNKKIISGNCKTKQKKFLGKTFFLHFFSSFEVIEHFSFVRSVTMSFSAPDSQARSHKLISQSK